MAKIQCKEGSNSRAHFIDSSSHARRNPSESGARLLADDNTETSGDQAWSQESKSVKQSRNLISPRLAQGRDSLAKSYQPTSHRTSFETSRYVAKIFQTWCVQCFTWAKRNTNTNVLSWLAIVLPPRFCSRQLQWSYRLCQKSWCTQRLTLSRTSSGLLVEVDIFAETGDENDTHENARILRLSVEPWKQQLRPKLQFCTQM